jgi:hypothetical protein
MAPDLQTFVFSLLLAKLIAQYDEYVGIHYILKTTASLKLITFKNSDILSQNGNNSIQFNITYFFMHARLNKSEYIYHKPT